MKSKDPEKPIESHPVNRRNFIAGVGAAAVSFTAMKPELVRGAQANSKIRLGLLGCGGRGIWIANLFQKQGGFELVAGADYFADRVEAFGSRFKVPAKKLFTGLAGYRRLLESGVDAVAIMSPPYFHPEQAAAAVEAGLHVFVAKPIAVDVPGCQSIAESGRRATERKRCFLVDFQTRADRFFTEALRRVGEGALGEFAFGESTYHAGDPFAGKYKYLEADADDPANRLRAWGLDRVISGDIITEQNIHTLDVMSWIMGAAPVSACGTGGRKFRPLGTCYDTFSVVYQYPNDVGVTFSSRQFNGHDSKPDGIRNRMFGANGVLETQYGGNVMVRGKNFYRGGKSPGIYQEGAQNNIATFHDSITKGKFENATVAPSVRSNLVTVLGREAAYRKELVTWKEMIKRGEKLDARLKGLKD